MVVTVQARRVSAMDAFGVKYNADCIEVERPRFEQGQTLPRVSVTWWRVH